MLVLRSLGAIVPAMVGFGSSPVQISRGRSPWSGVMVGHVLSADCPAAAAGTEVATAAAKISDMVRNVWFTLTLMMGSE